MAGARSRRYPDAHHPAQRFRPRSTGRAGADTPTEGRACCWRSDWRGSSCGPRRFRVPVSPSWQHGDIWTLFAIAWVARRIDSGTRCQTEGGGRVGISGVVEAALSIPVIAAQRAYGRQSSLEQTRIHSTLRQVENRVSAIAESPLVGPLRFSFAPQWGAGAAVRRRGVPSGE